MIVDYWVVIYIIIPLWLLRYCLTGLIIHLHNIIILIMKIYDCWVRYLCLQSNLIKPSFGFSSSKKRYLDQGAGLGG